MSLEDVLKAKPVIGMVAEAFLIMGRGQSICTENAENGVQVSFVTPFNTVPIVVIGPHQEKETWIDVNSITVSGFTWYSTQAQSGIDWIAVGT